MEITDIRLLLPALVSFKQNGKETSVFVYVDQLKKDVVIPDSTYITDIDEFKANFAKYYNSRNRAVKIPSPPQGFERNAGEYKL